MYEKLTKEQLRNDQRNYHIDGRYDQVVSQDYLRVDQSSSFESKQKPTLDEPQKMMKTVGRGDDNYRKIRSPKSPSDPGFQLRRSFDNNNFPQHLEESRKDEVSATQPSEITFEGNSYGNDNDNEHHYRDKGGNRKTEVQIEDADDEMSSNNEIGVQLDEDVYKVARGFAKELGSSSLPLTEEQLKSELQSLDVEIGKFLISIIFMTVFLILLKRLFRIIETSVGRSSKA